VCEAVPVIGSFSQLLFFSGWVGICFLRALTEERHLEADSFYLNEDETAEARVTFESVAQAW
jgi:hypothetical protein